MKQIYHFLALVVVISLLGSCVCDTSQDSINEQNEKAEGFNKDLAQQLLELKRKIPRKTIYGEDAPKRMELTEDYGYFLAAMAAPGVLFAVLSLISCVFFCIFRYICNCCGGRSYKGDGYKKGQVRRVRCGILVVAVIGIGFASTGMTGNTFLGRSVDKVFDFIDATANRIIDILDGLKADVLELIDIVADVNIDTEPYDQAIAGLRKGQDEIMKQEDMVQEYEGYRDVGTWIYFAIVGGTMVGYFVLSCLLLGWLTWLLTILFWIFIFFNWILFAVFLPLSVALSDACYEIDYAMDPENENEYFKQLIQCIDPDILDQFLGHMDEIKLGAIVWLNYDGFYISLQDSDFPYANASHQVPVNTSNVDEARAVYFDDAWMVNANATHYVNHSRSMYEAMDKLVLLIDKIEVLGTCQFVQEGLTGFRNILCIDIIMAIDLMTFALLGTGLLSWILIPCGVKAKKRFKKKNTEKAMSLTPVDHGSEMDEFSSGVIPAAPERHYTSHSSSSYDSYDSRPIQPHCETAVQSPPPYAELAPVPSPVVPPTTNVMPTSTSPYAPSPYANAWGASASTYGVYEPVYVQPTVQPAAPVYVEPYAQPQPYVQPTAPVYAEPSAPMLTAKPEDMKLMDVCNNDVQHIDEDDI